MTILLDNFPGAVHIAICVVLLAVVAKDAACIGSIVHIVRKEGGRLAVALRDQNTSQEDLNRLYLELRPLHRFIVVQMSDNILTVGRTVTTTTRRHRGL